MQKYQRKTAPVVAVQWNGYLPDIKRVWKQPNKLSGMVWSPFYGLRYRRPDSLGGDWAFVELGDWLVKEEGTPLQHFSPAEFQALFEPRGA